jgi:hypothetical protein
MASPRLRCQRPRLGAVRCHRSGGFGSLADLLTLEGGGACSTVLPIGADGCPTNSAEALCLQCGRLSIPARQPAGSRPCAACIWAGPASRRLASLRYALLAGVPKARDPQARSTGNASGGRSVGHRTSTACRGNPRVGCARITPRSAHPRMRPSLVDSYCEHVACEFR